MNIKHEDVESLLRFLKRKKGTLTGLLVLLFFLNSAFFSFGWLVKTALENTKIVDTATDYVAFYISAAALWLVLNMVVLILWRHWRQPPRFSFEKAGILFAPHSTSECTDLVETLYEGFCQNLANRGLGTKITYAFLPPTEKVRGHDDAHKLMMRTGAQVIIHGPVDRGQVDGKNRSGFTPISFTVRSLVLGQNEVQPMIAALKQMNFEVSEANSMIDKSVVAENLADTSCFFVAMALLLQGRQVEARSVWNELRTTVAKRVATGKKNIQILQQLADHWWRVNEVLYCRALYTTKIQRVLGTEHELETANEARAILATVRRTGLQRMSIEQLDAIFHFHLGDIQQARRICEDSEKLTQKKDAAPYFSLAFLALWQGKWKVALHSYRKAEKPVFDINTVMSVLDFLEPICANRPDKPQLLFALAIVNDMFFDPQQAKTDYRDFLKAVEGMGGFSELAEYAAKRLSELTARSVLYPLEVGVI